MTSNPISRWIVLIETEGFSERDEAVQARLHNNLYDVTDSALSRAGVSRDQYTLQDHGDGLLILMSADTAPTRLVREFVRSLDDALARYRGISTDAYRLRLRVGFGHGLVALSHDHWTGAAINDLTRLLDAAPVKQTLAQAEWAHLVLVVSEDVYQSVVRYAPPGVDPAAFGPTELVTRHGKKLRAWVTVPGYSEAPGRPPEAEADLHSEARGSQGNVKLGGTSGDYVSGSKIVYVPGEVIRPAGHTPPGPAQDPDDDWPRETPES
ncbi:hypothetical protein AB0N92_18120 [Streptomyces sp. NPDC093248]|uniref:hypothetical protein n=1 Tax=Streptomyces sp. NPDC093248 TaxID=3155072 RepID=UPI00344296B1